MFHSTLRIRTKGRQSMKPATGDSGIAGLGKGRRTDRSVLLMLGRDDLLPSVYLIKPAVPSDIDMNTWRNQEYFRIRTRNPTTSGTIGLPTVIKSGRIRNQSQCHGNWA